MIDLRIDGISAWIAAVAAAVAVVLLLFKQKSRGITDTAPLQRPPLVDESPETGVPDQGNVRDNWLARRKRYGNVFRMVEPTGGSGVYVGDALALKDVIEQPEHFDIGPLHIFAAPMWGISETTGNWLAREGGGINVKHSSHLFSGSRLASLQQRFVDAVQRQFERMQPGATSDLFQQLRVCFFQSTVEALFTKSFPEGQYASFCIWDAELNAFSRGCPPPEALTARDSFFNIVLQQIDEHLSECSLQVRELMADLEQKHGLSHRDAVAICVRTAWLGSTQSPLSGAWIISLLLQQPNMVQRLRTEIDTFRKSTGAPKTVGEIAANPDLLKGDNLPLLDNIVNEVLRVYSAQNVPRFCLQDAVVRILGPNNTIVPMQLKQGDVLQLLFWNVHDSQHNPQWWPEQQGKGIKYNGALEPFDETRFETDRRPAPFKIGGETVRTWTPFGFGMRVCPGRYWAVAEIKAFCLLFLDRFDVSSAGPMPRPDPQRWIGVLNVLDPLPATVSLRA